MKSISKILIMLVIFNNVYARNIIIISYDKESYILKLMKKEYSKMPQKLFRYYQTNLPCVDKYKDALLHWCIENDELKLVRSNHEVLKKSLSTLQR